MKKFLSALLILGILLAPLSGWAQKDNPVLVKFLSPSQLMVAYQSGLNTVFNIPDLSIDHEFAPDDKKNKSAFAFLSPNKDYLVTYDSKNNKRIIWNVATGAQVFFIESGYNAPEQFIDATRYVIGLNKSLNVLTFKIYDIRTGEILGDLDNLELPYRGIKYSPSGNIIVNYNNNSLDNGGYVIINVKNGNKIIKGSLKSDNTAITDVEFEENESSVNLIYQRHMGTESYYIVVPVANDSFDASVANSEKHEAITNNASSLIATTVINGFSLGNEILIPLDKDYSFRAENTAVSPRRKWSVMVSNKGVMVVLDNEDTQPIEQGGKTYKQPKEVTRKTFLD